MAEVPQALAQEQEASSPPEEALRHRNLHSLSHDQDLGPWQPASPFPASQLLLLCLLSSEWTQPLDAAWGPGRVVAWEPWAVAAPSAEWPQPQTAVLAPQQIWHELDVALLCAACAPLSAPPREACADWCGRKSSRTMTVSSVLA